MKEQTLRTYNVKLRDFIPIIGVHLYQQRCWKDRRPQPYGRYLSKLVGLMLLDYTSGFAILYGAIKGLEALTK